MKIVITLTPNILGRCHKNGRIVEIPKYTKSLLVSLAMGALVGMLLFAANPELGIFAILMLLNIVVTGIAGTIYAVKSILLRESLRWIAIGYLVLEIGGVIWALIDM